jgi:hypothetical protein
MGFYVLAHGQGKLRDYPPHGFTAASITMKRFKENTSALAISVNFLYPFLRRFNKDVEAAIDEGSVVHRDELLKIASDSAKESLVHFLNLLLRVTVQTGIGAFLTTKRDSYSASIVYAWDMAPRLNQKYCGELLERLFIPRFLAAALGPKETLVDLKFFQTDVSPMAAFEDSMKRNGVAAVADFLVDSVQICMGNSEPKVRSVASRFITHSITLVSAAIGSAGGRVVGKDRGEFWGEKIGALSGSLFCAILITRAGLLTHKAQMLHK